MQAIAALAGALPNTMGMGLDTMNRALDRNQQDRQFKAREEAFTSVGLPAFLAYQGGGGQIPYYHPNSYTNVGGRTNIRTGMLNSPYTGPSNALFTNAASLTNSSSGNQSPDDPPPPYSPPGTRQPSGRSKFVPTMSSTRTGFNRMYGDRFLSSVMREQRPDLYYADQTLGERAWGLRAERQGPF